MPFAVASMISPSGMTLAGKHGTGVLSIGSMSTAGLQALPTQWGFAEDSAAKHGNQVHRADWRVVLSWHLAETKQQAQEEAKHGLLRWHNEYTVGTLMRPGAEAYADADQALEEMAGGDSAMAIIGTPDELVEAINRLQKLTGGFGTVIGFVNDWANPQATFRSWDMVARYVIPEVNGMLAGYRESQAHVIANRDVFERAGQAVISKIMENERAVQAMSEEADAQSAIPAHHAPDLGKQGSGS
jgi:limonene 1,2-monooxygenase